MVKQRPQQMIGQSLSFGMATGAAVMGARWAWAAFRQYVLSSLAQPARIIGPEIPTDFGLDYEEVWFASRDAIRLHGWFIPSPANKATIVLGHGFSGNKTPDLIYTRFLHDGGYNVFMFDCRAHGRSEGDYTSIGYMERLDMLGAIDWLKANKSERRIGAMGFSMGAACALYATAESPDVRGVVADSPPAYIPYAIQSHLRKDGIPPFIARILSEIGYAIVARHMGFRASRRAADKALARISPRPMLLIYGEKDDLTEVRDHAPAWVRPAFAGERNLWIVADTGHAEAFATQGDLYVQRILTFFDAIDWTMPVPPTIEHITIGLTH